MIGEKTEKREEGKRVWERRKEGVRLAISGDELVFYLMQNLWFLLKTLKIWKFNNGLYLNHSSLKLQIFHCELLNWMNFCIYLRVLLYLILILLNEISIFGDDWVRHWLIGIAECY